jgi:protocadherin Fat 1/2/3
VGAAVSVSLSARGRAAAIFDHGQESFRITTTDTSVQVYTASDGALKTLGVANVRGLCHTDIDGTLLLAIMRFNQGPAWQTTSFVYSFNAATMAFKPFASVATHGGSGCTFFKGPTTGDTFLAVANFNNNGRETSINSFVYRLAGSNFNLFATLPTRGAVDATALKSDTVDGVLVVFANSYDTDTLSYETESSVWQLSSENAGFALFQSITVPGAQSVAAVHPADGGPPMLVFASLRTDAGVSDVYCPVLRYNGALRTFTEVQRLSALDTGFRGVATVQTGSTNVLLLAAFGDNDNAIAATSSPIYVFDAGSQLWQLSSAIAGTAAVSAAAGSFRGVTKLGLVVDNSLVSLTSPAALFVDLTTLSAIGDARFASAGAPPSFLAMDSAFARVEMGVGQNFATLIVREDALDEVDEAITLTLFSADGEVFDTATLTILDNDVTIFTAREFSLSVQENKPTGTLVVPTVTTRALQSAEIFSFALANFPGGRFMVDSSTGAITTAAMLDREAQGVIVGSIIVTSSQFPGATDTATVTITVGDENDNAPQLGASTLTFFLAEGAPVGTVVTTLVASDADVDGPLQYTMAPPSALFSVNASSGVVTTVRAFELDGAGADASSYTFDVTASDGLFSDVAKLRIIVTDDNDNAPTFPFPTETITRAEDLAPGSLITTFTATDADSSLANSLITYRIQSGNTAPVTIEASTGRLTLSGPLDYETVKSYNFTVIATDSNIASPLSGLLKVTLYVTDVNDAGPSFEEESTTLYISESTETGTTIATLAAEDPDGSPDGTRYTVDSPFVEIDATGAVKLTQMVDREMLSSFSFVVTATDEDNGLSATISVLVNVLDENDNRPVWVERPTAVILAEDTPIGTTVASFRATDVDQGENGRVSFRINPVFSVGADLFKIDENTGVVTLVGDLDYETEPVLSLRIVASDNGSPPLRIATQFTVTLTDVNDEPPQAASLSRSVTIAENASVGDTLVDLEVSDADVLPSFSNLTFSVAPDEGLFRVRKDGLVVLAGELDREESSSHNFTVTVSDGVASIDIEVFVTVSDVNDNSPTFVGGRSSLTVSESASVGLILETYTLSDRDEGGAEGVTLTAISSPANMVTIGAGNTLRLAAPLDYESNRAVSVILTASDGKFETTLAVSITILNVNEFRPVFSKSVYSVTLTEGAVGELITVSATDDDADEAGEIRFSLAVSTLSSRFVIDAVTGTVSVVSPFDAEVTTGVDITVVATDQDPNSPSSSTATLRVNIADVNDEPPIFTPNRLATTVSESASVGLTIVQTTVTDADATSVNRAVIYAIVSGDPENNFVITSTGAVKVRKTLEFLTGDVQRQLNITATNTAIPRLQGRAIVDVTIDPSNEFAPSFSPEGSLAVLASEGLVVGAVIPGATFVVTDADAGIDGEVDFRIVGGSPFKLNVTRSSGAYFVTLQVATPLDRESRDTYTVIVEANDRSAFSLMSRAIFNVTVGDENDNPPQFMPESYAATLEENIPVGTRVLRVKATDRDIAPNNEFIYVLSDSNVPFALNESTGVISIRELIDYEALSVKFFEFSVVARPTQGDDVSAPVKIEIQDVNDNRPVITSAESITVKESVKPRSLLTTFTATDADTGNNARVRFRILSGNENDDLSLDASGALFSAKSLDYERLTHYRLSVQAYDLGIPSLVTNFSVLVTVEDENDNDPVFSEPGGYTFTVVENRRAGVALNATTTGPITALDADNGGDSGLFRFEFAAGTNVPFALDPLSGQLTTTASLDREEQQEYTFIVRVIDQPSEPRLAEVSVRVEVIDVNDNDPIFVPAPPTRVSVGEDAAVGSVLASFSAIDPDNAGNLSYAVAQATPSMGTLLFEMDQLGNLLVASSLDFESSTEFSIVVRATDAGEPARSAETTLVLTLTDVNDNAPQFDRTAYVLSVDEEIAVGSALLELNVTDLDSNENGELRVELVASPAALAFSVAFDAASGVATLRSAARLDREAKPNYVVELRATDGGVPALSASVTVTIHLRDINDNSPVFASPVYSGSVLENAPPGQEIAVIFATDDDAGDNGIVSYNLVSWSNIFSINATSGSLTARMPLDRESRPNGYVVLVQAVDGGQPPNMAVVNVSVNVLDEADSAPAFAKSRYSFTVEENRAAGSPVGTVFAKAQDIVVRQNVSYTLQGGGDVTQFNIDEKSGLITTTTSFDREARATYQLVVQATTDGPNPLSSTVIVDVSVSDLNDNTPVFVSQPQVRPSVAETQPAGFVAFSVSAVDADAGKNAEITYTIDSGNSDGAFVIDANTGQVSVSAVRLDYERRQAYLLVIKASDGGNPTRSATVTVVVDVLDVNDEPPIFASSFDQVQPVEHMPPGQRVATISATDRDLDPANNRVTYELIGGVGADLFSLDAFTGVMRTTASLDREVRPSYSLTVRATDSGTPPLTATTTIIIAVADINDNRPQPPPGLSTALSVLESAVPDEKVAQIEFSDADSGINAQLSYMLSGTGSGDFAVSSTGVITVARKLDRETRPIYSLRLTVRDLGDPPLSNFVDITITALDVNDNAPVLSGPSAAKIPESAEIDTLVALYTATDADIGANALIAFTLTSGNTENAFRIGSFTGQLQVAAALDYEKQTEYVLEITAYNPSDPLGPNSTVSLSISILDINDNNPVLSQATYNVTIAEEEPPTALLTLQATDADAEFNTNFAFAFVGSVPGAFELDAVTGVLSTTRPLDFETDPATFTFQVRVSDGHHPVRFSNVATVTVTVQDINDNAPAFSASVIRLSVPENEPVGVSLGAVTATDPDSGAAGAVSYSLTGVDAAHFRINSNTGTLTTAATFDREARSSYSLTVIASDGGSPQRSSQTSVVVTILDVNDNAPTLSSSSGSQRNFTFAEDVPVGTAVVTLISTDDDAGDNGLPVFELISGGGGVFSVGRTSGIVYISSALDYESTKSYRLVVIVRDNTTASGTGVPQPAQSIEFTITVTDVNDNAPAFLEKAYFSSVNEAEPSGTVLSSLFIEAVDADQGGTQKFFYGIQGEGSEDFSIDAESGQLALATALDRETRSVYNLVVTATDDDTMGPLTGSASLTINVLDDNDNDPIFTVTPRFEFTIPEDTPAFTVVGKVEATDPDEGLNAKITYSLTGGATGRFSINETTGELTLRSAVDREVRDIFRILVQAADNGQPQRRVEQQAIIRISDVNDNAPVLSPSSKTLFLSELTAVGTTLVKFTATDADIGDNAAVAFRLTVANSSELFGINATSGALFLAQPFDIRAARQHFLIVEVFNPTDEAGETDTADVFISVFDENDNAPEFRGSLTFNISEDAALGSAVGVLQATDADEGFNAEIIFAWADPAAAAAFTLDSITGNITVRAALDRETVSIYTLNVTASDRGAVPKTTFALITIHILDVNDNFPVFTPRVYTIEVPEDAAVGTKIVQLIFSDADSSDQPAAEKLQLRIVDDFEGTFLLDRDGILKVNATLDRETTPSYTVTISIEDTAQQAGIPATVLVTVGDVNDNAPRFDSDVFRVAISESASPALPRNFVATDPDAGENGVVLYTLDANVLGFSVNTFGFVQSSRPLDFEATPTFNLTIRARDNGTDPLSASALIIVTVLNANKNEPRFSAPFILANISETAPVGSEVVVVRAYDDDVGDRLSYSFQAPSAFFAISEDTGAINVRNPLDYETDKSHTLFVRVSDGRNFAFTTLFISVIDENDNAPIFQLPAYEATVVETLQVDNVIVSVSATDADAGINGQIIYALVNTSQSGKFSLDAETGELTLREPLDHEESSTVLLTVLATDGGGLSTSAGITIRVLDLNDNAPRFLNETFQISVLENAPVGTLVEIVAAEDPDEGDNAAATYTITGDDADNFSVDVSTGAIYTTTIFDRESRDTYRITITARDAGILSSVFFDSAEVIVTIVDTNDHAPIISPSTTERLLLKEDVAIGLVIAEYSATDKDIGVNGELRYNLQLFEAFDAAGRSVIPGTLPFAVGEASGVVTVDAPLDRETIAFFLVNVIVADRSESPLNATAQLEIEVTDVNDNPPRFNVTRADVSRSEKTAMGDIVYQAQAVDADLGQNAVVTYSIVSGNDNGTFAISSSLGTITLVKELDREAVDEYSLTIRAADRGNLSTTLLLVVTVLDVNDNNPRFEGDNTRALTVTENSLTPVSLTLTATDADIGANADITFTLTGPVAYAFEVVHTDINGVGEVRLIAPLDREETGSTTNLTVVARDAGVPALSSTLLIVVTVLDVNDNDPTFGQEPLRVSFRENIASGVVAVLSIDDADEGVNGEVRISISPPPDGFAVDPSTFEVTLLRSFDYEVEKEFIFNITAIDLGSPPRSSRTQLIVTVLDTNDNAPVFDALSYSASVAEDAAVGTVVLSVSASDADSGNNARLEYYVVRVGGLASDGAGIPFDLNSASGNLTIRAPLDYETDKNFDLTILVVDNPDSGSQLNDTVEVSIQISDVNDNAPRFRQDIFNGTASEDTQAGATVVTIAADDPDLGAGGVVRYSFLGTYSDFVLDTVTGVITVSFTADFDRELTPFYTLRVQATDLGSPPLASNGTVRVAIGDINDNPPIFPSASASTTTSEGVSKDAPFFIIQASDADIGDNAFITYSLDSVSPAGAVEVDPTTGGLFNVNLDYETSRQVRVVLRATNTRALPRFSSSITIDITVTDANDVAPIFNPASYKVAIRENDIVGRVLAVGMATDPDTGLGGIISYGLRAANDQDVSLLFEIDAISGVVTTLQPLDRGLNATYNLLIVARDLGSPPLESTAPLLVTVLDINESNPTFDNVTYKATLSEAAAPGTVVVTVKATDPVASSLDVIYAIVLPETVPFVIDTTTGVIVSAGIFDREGQDMYTFAVTASDGGDEPRTATAQVTVVITDINDNLPQLQNVGSRFSVSEDAPVGTTFETISVSDKDVGINAIATFRLVSITPNLGNVTLLSIDRDTGVLRVAEGLDRETAPLLQVTVEAQNTFATPTLAPVRGVYYVVLIDANDNAPVFDADLPTKVQVREDASPDTLVALLAASDADIELNGQISFSLKDDFGGTFDVGASSGRVTVIKRLNRNTMPSYNVVAVATDAGEPQLVSRPFNFTVVVTDVSDKVPIFLAPVYSATVPENEELNKTLITVQARDPEGRSALLRYVLAESSPFFEMDEFSGSLKLISALNRKLKPRHTLLVLAINEDGRNSSAIVTIIVADSNDNSPVFIGAPYTVQIEENLSEVEIFVPLVEDADGGSNAALTFSLDNVADYSRYAIDEQTGRIVLLQAFDYETTKSTTVRIRVTDQGNTPKLAVAEITIIVIDVNDNAPELVDDDIKVTIPEDADEGTFVARLEGRDVDTPGASPLSFALLAQNIPFIIEVATGIITVSGPLDRETKDVYVIPTIVSDGAFWSRGELTVILSDVNDNPPLFAASTPRRIQIEESAPQGTLLVQLEASDADVNNTFSFRLANSTAGPGTFIVDPQSGELRLSGVLDFEVEQRFYLQVVVEEDNHSRRRRRDVRGKAHLLSRGRRSTCSERSLAACTGNCTIEGGTDICRDASCEEIFDMQSCQNTQGCIFESDICQDFHQRSTTTTTTTTTTTASTTTSSTTTSATFIDPENVFNSDNAGCTGFCDVRVIIVVVIDVNDNKPVFLEDAYEVDVFEDAAIDTVLTAVSASDADAGINAIISYRLLSDEGRFAIDAASGAVRLTAGLDFEKTQIYQLQIEAADGGVPSLTAIVTLTINVLDVNDNPPRFEVASLSIEVPEDAPVGTILASIIAEDKDRGINSEIRYALVDNANVPFAVDSATGALTLTGALDRETIEAYLFDVVASDFGSPSLSSALTVAVTVTDINDNTPIFQGAPYSASIDENLRVVSAVLTVLATDADIGSAGTVRYSLIGPQASKFFIQPTTGEIVAVPSLDYEATPSFVLTVVATDQAPPFNAAEAELFITVNDVNDNAPVFSSATYNSPVLESLPVGSIVLRATASDVDTGAIISYSLTDSSGTFAINSSTGEVTTTKPLDRESVAQYTVGLVARDEGGLVGRATLTVPVLDVNDNAPVFIRDAFSGTVVENTVSETQVVRVEAVDADLGDNSRITYAFVDPLPDNFAIDGITGVVTAITPLDREAQDTHIFSVVAFDGGTPRLFSAPVPVTITVIDVNDNTPVFGVSPTAGSNFISVGSQGIPEYAITLLDVTCTPPYELCDVGSPVLRLRASDADLGVNAALTYYLLTATSDFAIDTATGDLLLGRPIDREQQNSFSLTVEVRDGASGQAMRSARAAVTISIGDLNDNAPVFDGATLSSLFVSESAASGTLLTTFVARDADAGSNAVVRYSLRRDDESFANADGRVTLDFVSGELRVFALDFEAESSFDLNIVAADSGSPSLATSTTLTVRVTDVNDNTPRLSSKTLAQTTTVSEVFRDGVGIFGFVGEDADGTVINSDMGYALTDAPRTGWFSLDSHSDGTVTGSGVPRVVVGNNLRFRTGLANTFNITVSARNPLASTGVDLRDAISRQVEIVPFLGSTTPPDATVQTFNFQMPDVCADYPTADFCEIGARRRRRRALSSNHYEIWMRRGFDCNALACQGYDASLVVNGVCNCRIYGPEREELDATLGYAQDLQQYTYPGLRADTAYEFQLRIYDESFELLRVSEYYGLRTVNFNVGSPRVIQISGSPSFNVTWGEPSTPNGRLVGYRVCYCPPSVQPVLCTCGHSEASAVPSSGLTRRRYAIVPEVNGALRSGVNYTFVVEVETTLEDASTSLTYSDPVRTPDPAIYDTGSSGSSNMVGSGSIAGIILGLVVLLMLVVLLVLVSRRKRSRSGRSNMSVKPMGKDMNGNDMELEPVKRSMLQDSMGSGLDLAGSGTAGDDNGGYWDYFVKERANQFWPEGLQSESFTEAPVMESVVYDGEPHSTAARTRQFGLNTVRVMADGFGGMQVGAGDMAWETASGRHAGAPGGAPGAAMGAASTGAKSGASRELELKFLGQLEGPTTIKATVMEERVAELRAKGTIDAEFAKIKQDSAASDLTFHTAMETYNVRKNRYGNVLPIDATRVLLSHSGVLGSDYINANYLPGFRRPSAFVATQAPVPNTIPDFWRMVWEQQAGVIVMITREVEMGKVKCHKYWPDAGMTIRVGELEVTFVSYDAVCEDYGIRKLLLRDPASGEVREITQFVYQTWPDHGVPTSPAALIRYILDVRRHVEAARAQGSGSGPAVVHCSAGIGRTGTFFAVNALMQRLDALGTVDVMSTVAYLRTYRAGSVQTLDQYRYIYDALLTYYRSNPSIHHLASSVQQGSRAAAASALPGSYAGSQMFVSEYGNGEVPNYDQEVVAMGQDATLNSAEDPEYLIRALNRL